MLKKRAARLRKETGDPLIAAPVELESKSYRDFIVLSLSRPLGMLFLEPLVYLSCLYIAFLYAFFYLFFQAYPIIFEGEPRPPADGLSGAQS